jgi:hypothetical protein
MPRTFLDFMALGARAIVADDPDQLNIGAVVTATDRAYSPSLATS